MKYESDPFLHRYFSRYEPNHRSSSRKILFLVGSLGQSGGTNLILQNAYGLLDDGCQVEIAALNRIDEPSWHPAGGKIAIRTMEEASEFSYDSVVATWWPTVYHLPRFRAKHYCYFVQSIESRFLGDDPLGARHEELAHLTYTYGLDTITVARWIEIYLARNFNTLGITVRNGVEKQLFSPGGPNLGTRPTALGLPPRVLVEGPDDVPFKGVKRAIQVAKEAGCTDIWHVGKSTMRDPQVTSIGLIPYNRMAEVYRSCDILVKLSEIEGMYGPPIEMFHCGGTVVSFDVTGHSEYMSDGFNAKVTPLGDYAKVRKDLSDLMLSNQQLNELKSGALQTAQKWPSIAETRREFAKTLVTLIETAETDFSKVLSHISGIARWEEL